MTERNLLEAINTDTPGKCPEREIVRELDYNAELGNYLPRLNKNGKLECVGTSDEVCEACPARIRSYTVELPQGTFRIPADRVKENKTVSKFRQRLSNLIRSKV